MARRDGFSRGAESLEDIYASDRFIEQLRVSGTYEPSSREDAAFAAALLTWRDEMQADPITPPPRADEVAAARPFVQPHRIARRAVAAAGALLAMSSAMATAFDADPLRPVRFLVDVGVTVGERIGHPTTSEDSSEDAPTENLSDDPGPQVEYTVPKENPESADTEKNPEVTGPSPDDNGDDAAVDPDGEDPAPTVEPTDVPPDEDGDPVETQDPPESPDETEEPDETTEPPPPTEPTDPTDPPTGDGTDGDGDGEDTDGEDTDPGANDQPLDNEPDQQPGAPAESTTPPDNSGDPADEGTKGDDDSKGSSDKGDDDSQGDDDTDTDADGWPGDRFDDLNLPWWESWFWDTDTMAPSDRSHFSQKAAWNNIPWLHQGWNHPGHSHHSD